MSRCGVSTVPSAICRHAFHRPSSPAPAKRSLEQRDGKPWPLPGVWLTSGGRPDGVLEAYGFVLARSGLAGHYTTQEAAWRVHVLVLPELPRIRETILLRLLGQSRVRRYAIADLLALPDGAWEKKVALPWLARLRFEVPADPAEQLDEERAFIMEIQEWFEQYQLNLRKEGRNEGRVQALGRLFAKRLARPLAEAELGQIAERLDRLGEDRLDDVLLGFAPDALAAWLADPAAR